MDLLSCPNLFCLINSFYPSCWSNTSGCVVCPTSQQALLSSHTLSLSLSFFLLCFSSLYLRWPTCWAGPLSTRHAAERTQSRHAVTMATIRSPQTTRPQKVPALDLRSVSSTHFYLYGWNTNNADFSY